MTTTTEREPQRIQVWPSGNMMTYSGPLNGPYEVEVDGVWRSADADERRILDIDLHAKRYADVEILTCQSYLVSELLKKGWDGGLDGFTWDDVENLLPDPSDWGISQCRNWLDDYGHGWPLGRTALMEVYEEQELPALEGGESNDDIFDAIDWTVEDHDDWREAVTDNAEPAEVFEWWLVSSWLCGKLRAAGIPVIDNDYGTWWGRTCTGQALIMDGTLQEIAEAFATP